MTVPLLSPVDSFWCEVAESLEQYGRQFPLFVPKRTQFQSLGQTVYVEQAYKVKCSAE